MERFNLFAAALEYDPEDPDGYRAGMARFGKRIGARDLGGTVYELPPGQSNCPYHYEHGVEEWLIVLDGAVSVRRPEGERTYERGDVVCFPEGPAGAHKLTNRGAATVRLLMLSTIHEPNVAVYPDSDKLGIWPGDARDALYVRRESAVGYWDREA